MVTKHINKNDSILENVFQNTIIPFQNTVIPFQNTVILNKCHLCDKILSSKKNLEYHINICKGTTNSLECHICHKVFANSSSKSCHIKKCKEKQSLLIIQNETKEDNDIILNQKNENTIINNCNINNGTIINGNVNMNVNLISFNSNTYRLEDFDISHLNLKEILSIVSKNDPDTAFFYFMTKLFENKNNQMIIKTSLRNKYSHIHLGMNIWEKYLDTFIYPIILIYIADTMISFVGTSNDKKHLINLDKYLNIMASNGISDEETNDYKKKYKINIDKLKLICSKYK